MSPAPSTVQKIPALLRRYVVKQEYNQYTPINQATWRYVMRQNIHFFQEHAHHAYSDGLAQSGIYGDHIPSTEEMNACLESFGWSTVAIDGLIPSVAFFGFQAHRILPIATDIRTLEHIAYTPTPDIIHEAAGHAPILCDPTYSRYVQLFGEIGAKALASQEELALFEAVRHLSRMMENPSSTPEMIRTAEETVHQKQSLVTQPSEATLLSRLYWWTVEYGLIGDLHNPKIYGAGLLSSMGEGQQCLDDHVRKLPFDLETCIQTDYDVTRPQPQLFVCQDFTQLVTAVEKFAERMAFRVGGTESLHKAARSADLATTVYSSGLQVSGIFTRVLTDEHGEAIYLQTTGSTTLAHDGQELPHHGKATHFAGFGAPIGKVADLAKPLEQFSPDDLQHLREKEVILSFTSGVRVEGIVQDWVHRNGKLLLLSFRQCTVTQGDQTLFHPDWGTYDMAVGEQIISVFAGAADPESFFADEASEVSTHDSAANWTELDHLYQTVREVRKGKRHTSILPKLVTKLSRQHPDDWLLRIELVELLPHAPICNRGELIHQLLEQLEELKKRQPHLRTLIENGLRLRDI